MQSWARIMFLLAVTAAAACTRVPELEDQLTPDLRSAGYPKLLPLDTSMEPVAPPQQASGDLQQELEGRNARLKRRAKAVSNAEF